MTKEYVKNYHEEIRTIKAKQEEIDGVISTLPMSSWKQSLELSSMNFNKKLDKFLETGAELTAEQREAIAAIKSGKIPVSALSSYMEESSAGNNDETKTKTASTKKKR
jgi:hypothetical protein